MSEGETASHKLALVQTHLAVLLLAGTALFSKLVPLNAAAISLARALVAFVLLLVIVKVSEKRLRLHSTKDAAIACILGTFMALHWVTYFYAMQYSTVATGMIALYTFPVLTVLIEPLLHKQKPSLKDVILAFVVLVGVALMVPDLNLDSEYTLGILLGVVSAFFFAFRNILNKSAFAHYSGTKNMMFQALVISLCILPFEWQSFSHIESANTWGLLLILGIFFTALPHVLIVSGLKHLKAKSMSLIACLSPFYGAVLAAFFLSEYPNLTTVVGGTIVVSAAIFETLSVTNKSPK